MVMQLPQIMVRCLILTIIIESAAAFLFGVRNKKDFLNILLINVITNPLVVTTEVAVGMLFGNGTAEIFEYFVEAAVVLTEGLFYRKFLRYKKINPILLSFILNGLSYLIGEIINKIIY